MEKLRTRQIQPFPIAIGEIKDDQLKSKILILNNSFNNYLINNLKVIDIDSCEGEQDFSVEGEHNVCSVLKGDTLYTDMLYVMLSQFYKRDVTIEYILTGKFLAAIDYKSSFDLKCRCKENSYAHTYQFTIIDDFETDRDKALSNLIALKEASTLCFNEEPTLKRGDHHNFVQSTTVKEFKDLSSKNRRVLNILRYFGLFTLILERGHEDDTQPYGEIEVQRVEENHTNSILKGTLFCDNGVANEIELFFPPKVATDLVAFIGKRFTDIKLRELKDKLLL